MALLLVQPGVLPAGQFDLEDDTTIVGGEIGVFDTFALDANGFQVISVRRATTGDTGPFFLLDDGVIGYGTYFGSTVLGSTFGLPSYVASGEVTVWDKQGLYAVTLDALADTEAALKAAAPGSGLTIDPTGKLKLGSSSVTPIAYIIQFKHDESLVTTSGSAVNNKKLVIYFNPTGFIT